MGREIGEGGDSTTTSRGRGSSHLCELVVEAILPHETDRLRDFQAGNPLDERVAKLREPPKPRLEEGLDALVLRVPDLQELVDRVHRALHLRRYI